MCRFLLVSLAFTAALFGQTVGVGTFIHVVADLDKTIHFYRDDLGLELTGAPGPRAFSQNAVVEGLYDAKGSQSRVAVLKVPGSPLGLEFAEFKDIEQNPCPAERTGPGAPASLF
jgi:catechol 2,3-dioxygenase-like lactoylglutathione lyase family enzyme